MQHYAEESNLLYPVRSHLLHAVTGTLQPPNCCNQLEGCKGYNKYSKSLKTSSTSYGEIRIHLHYLKVSMPFPLKIVHNLSMKTASPYLRVSDFKTSVNKQ